MLATDDTVDLKKLSIAANFGEIVAISHQLHTNKLSECLDYFAYRLRFEHSIFELSNVDAQHSQALLVDEFAPNMALQDKFIFACAPISINVNIEKDYFLMCLQAAYILAPRALPVAPVWLDSHNPKHLEAAENLSQNLSLYAWLSYKFPQIFVDGDKVSNLRQVISRYITRALLVQAGYGQTAREIDLNYKK
jgi:ATP-dependent RNA helicase SUPV3L1/SUV3